MSQGPLQDLSYRHYAGAMGEGSPVWWAIARNIAKTNLRKRGLWVLSALSAWWYFAIIVIMFVFEQFASMFPGGRRDQNFSMFLDNMVWRDQLIMGISTTQLLVLFMALMCTAGAIANDNRAKALLVYLAKPCTKLDYLWGKWLGCFLSILLPLAAPHLFFLTYGMLSYGEYGFVKQSPMMPVGLLISVPFVAAIYTSMVLGISSLFSQGRMAGVVSSAVYFLSFFFTTAYSGVLAFGAMTGKGSLQKLSSLQLLPYYCSIDGIAIAISKSFLSYDGTKMLFSGGGGRGRQQAEAISGFPALPVWIPLLMWAVLVGGGFLLAYSRIRAVEVVQ